MDQIIEHRSIQDRRSVELLARNRRAYDREDARANDRANTQRGKRHRPQCLLEAMLRRFRIADELVDRLSGEDLMRQVPDSCGLSEGSVAVESQSREAKSRDWLSPCLNV